MSRSANVSSIEVLKGFRTSLAKFVQVASSSLDETSGDIRRTSNWLRNDQYGYWKKQLQLRNELYVRAKLNLKRKQVFERSLSGSASSCLDEKKELQKAEKRLKEAEYKFSRTKTWGLRMEKESSDYRATVQGLVRAIEVDIPNARARLDKMIDALDAYIALAPPEMATADVLETTGGMDFVWSDVTRPTAEGEQPSEAKDKDLEQKGKALRKMTPLSKVRSKAKIDSDRAGWIAELKFSDALLSYILDCVGERAKTHPGDRVTLAVPKGKPDTIYLERMPTKKGDSGWYIGVGKESESQDCVAARVVDLVKLCPALAEVFGLPVGYLVMAGFPDGAQALFDSNGGVKWCASDSDSPAPKG